MNVAELKDLLSTCLEGVADNFSISRDGETGEIVIHTGLIEDENDDLIDMEEDEESLDDEEDGFERVEELEEDE